MLSTVDVPQGDSLSPWWIYSSIFAVYIHLCLCLISQVKRITPVPCPQWWGRTALTHRDYPPLGQGHTTLSPSFLAPVVWGSRVTASSWWGGMCCIISGCKHFIASMVPFYPIFACPPRDHGFLMVKSRVMGVLSAWVWEGGWSRLLWPIAGFAWVQVELWELRVSLFRLF